MAICPQCSFKDYLDVLNVDVVIPQRGSEPEKEATLKLAVCGTCGCVFCSNWKEFFLEHFAGKIVRNTGKD